MRWRIVEESPVECLFANELAVLLSAHILRRPMTAMASLQCPPAAAR
jgi:hypothetical protein